MGRITTAMMIGVATFAPQTHASDEWLDATTSTSCGLDGTLDEADGPLAVTMMWFRDSTKPATLIVRRRPRSFAHGGSISIVSPSLAQPLDLDAEQEFAAGGPLVDALMTDIGNALPWSLVLHPADGPERRVIPRPEDGARVFAMLGACRGFSTREPAPAAIAGQTRARSMHLWVLGTTCQVSALYGPRGHPFGLTLDYQNGITKLKPGHPELSAHFDLSSFGVADTEDAGIYGIPLSDVVAARLVSDLVAGAERRVPLRDSSGSSTLILGGPEFAIEAAMYKACIDVH